MTPLKVLIVDDEDALAGLLCEWCVTEQHAPYVIHDGLHVLEAIARWAPDVVLLDVMLPGANGLEVLRQLRDQVDVPVYLMSAHFDTEMAPVARQLGAQGYIHKLNLLAGVAQACAAVAAGRELPA